MTAVVLTYHGIDDADSPLCVSPRLFRAHLEVISRSGAQVMTLSELVERPSDAAAHDAVAITFDDGLRSVIEEAAPMLHARGMPATVFAVAGRLGADNGWPTQPDGAPRLPLAGAEELAALVDEGWEIGSHGMEHAPLAGASHDELEREIVASRRRLEGAIGAPIRSFAFPYGALPDGEGWELLRREYAVACTTQLGSVERLADPFLVPRIEIHYVRRPDLLERTLQGRLSVYLGARRLGARARRLLRKDYAELR